MRRARPWPERPVSAANKSGSDTAATRPSPTYSRSPLAGSGRELIFAYCGDRKRERRRS